MSVEGTELAKLREIMADIGPALPWLRALAENPAAVEKLADDIAKVAAEVAALSAKVAALEGAAGNPTPGT
jgi:ubiquinone biosynthesis protein UbiJ